MRERERERERESVHGYMHNNHTELINISFLVFFFFCIVLKCLRYISHYYKKKNF